MADKQITELDEVTAPQANDVLPIQTNAAGVTGKVKFSKFLDRVNHTGSQAISTITDLQSTLDAKETPSGAQSKVDTHANNVSNPHTVTATQVGLGNVDNTADLDKPISTATQMALDTKEPADATILKDADIGSTVAAQTDARFPTADEKAALAGTGTPSASNPFANKGDIVRQVADYAAAQALTNLSDGDQVSIAEEGRGGIFVYRTGDYTSEVTADTLSGIYLPLTADSDGSEGCLVKNRSTDFDRSRVMSIISSSDSVRKYKPNIKQQLKSDIASRLSTFDKIESYQFGATDLGLVFGGYTGYDSSVIQPMISVFVPASGEIGEWNCDVTIKSVSGLTSTFTVSGALVVDPFAGGVAPTLSATTVAGDVWSVAITNTSADEYIGFYIKGSTLSITDRFIITGYEITSPSGVVWSSDQNKILSESIVSLSRRSTSQRSIAQRWQNGEVSRMHGNLSGNAPRSVWIGASATLTEDSDSSSVGYLFDAFGYSGLRPMTAITAFQLLKVFAANGLDYPAIMCLPGTYDSLSSSVPHFDLSSITQDIRIYAPHGTATFEKTVSGGSGAVVDTGGTLNSSLSDYTLYMWGIYAAANQGRPFRIQHLNCIAYDCSAVASLVDCWEFDNNNFILQNCFAGAAANDGFNHHGYGHGVLVDCISDGNSDDGFSPHDLCTYEVWGGEYKNNGKGNVIPAYGAQGFCVGVSSSGATGTSPNAAPTNYGGFVALAEDSRRDTTMLLVDCMDDGSVIGINASGKNSKIRAIGYDGANNSEYAVGNFSWYRLAAPETVYSPGLVELYNYTLNGQTNINKDAINKIFLYPSTVFD